MSAQRYCKGPGCLAPIPTDEETYRRIKGLGNEAPSELLTSHAFGVCSPACLDRWDEAEDLARMKRWARAERSQTRK